MCPEMTCSSHDWTNCHARSPTTQRNSQQSHICSDSLLFECIEDKFIQCLEIRLGTDVWSRGLDSDKERGRATGENRNENAADGSWESH